MSMLNQLFNRGLLGVKCKTCLTLAISRIKLLQNKRDVQLKAMRKEIAEFLQTSQEAVARIRVEHIIREQNTWEAYEILELFCEFVLARVPILESQRECPTELQEAVASIIFAAPRCSDLPDLLHVRNLFASKYGKDFVAAASELRPDTSVNRTIIEKLSASAAPPDAKLKVLKAIAVECGIAWDSTNTETEFSKKPEDLLNGPKQIARQPQAQPKAEIWNNPSTSKHSAASLNGNQGNHQLKSPASLRSMSTVDHNRIGPSTREQNAERVLEIKNVNASSSSDILQKARIAITAAERASIAARAAAELANVGLSPFKLEERKT